MRKVIRGHLCPCQGTPIDEKKTTLFGTKFDAIGGWSPQADLAENICGFGFLHLFIYYPISLTNRDPKWLTMLFSPILSLQKPPYQAG